MSENNVTDEGMPIDSIAIEAVILEIIEDDEICRDIVLYRSEDGEPSKIKARIGNIGKWMYAEAVANFIGVGDDGHAIIFPKNSFRDNNMRTVVQLTPYEWSVVNEWI